MNLLNLTPQDAERELSAWLESEGQPPYRVRQVLPRLWNRPIESWNEALELPLELRSRLETHHPIGRLELAVREESRDGTVKHLWRLPDAALIESVLIPEGGRTTLCISSQAGCALGCVFCATGRMGFTRHLEPWEIAGQLREVSLREGSGKPDNVVFMGMGEPLHNWSAVDIALTILNDPRGIAIGARKITVSTVGLLPGLRALAARPEQFRLAISLHAPNSELRRTLMPVEAKYSLPQLVAALQMFRRRVTFEYVMIEGTNDGPEHAAELADLARRTGALINLLPLHSGGSSDLRPTPAGAIRAFRRRLVAAGANATIRKSRGVDINAACGQLRAAVRVAAV